MSSVETRFDLSAFEARITNSYRELIKTILIGGYALPHLEVIHVFYSTLSIFSR